MIQNRIDLKHKINLKRLDSDIYCGDERLKFHDRHPIYRTLMKLEFEEAIRNYTKNEKLKKIS